MSIRTKLCAGVAVLAVAATGCTAAAHSPSSAVSELVPAAKAAPTYTELPPCFGSIVQVGHADELDCDVSPPQRLDLVWDDTTEGMDSGWGSDASVQAAADECNDDGGEPIWHADGSYRLVCEGVDY